MASFHTGSRDHRALLVVRQSLVFGTPNVRLKALQICLDRGYGKATQHIEAETSVYDILSLAEKEALLEVLDALDVDQEGVSGRPALTHH